MSYKIVSFSVPVNMLHRIDEAAEACFQTRSNYIRLALVEKMGAKNQYEASMPVSKGDLTEIDEEFQEYLDALKATDQ